MTDLQTCMGVYNMWNTRMTPYNTAHHWLSESIFSRQRNGRLVCHPNGEISIQNVLDVDVRMSALMELYWQHLLRR